MLDLSDFCSSLINYRQFYFNCTGTKAMCYIKLGIGFLESEKAINATRIHLNQLKEEYPIYVSSNIYYTCEPLPKEWLELIPDMKKTYKSNCFFDYY